MESIALQRLAYLKRKGMGIKEMMEESGLYNKQNKGGYKVKSKSITIERLIKLHERNMDDYNQFTGYLQTIFESVLNPDMDTDIIRNNRQVSVNRVVVLSEKEKTFIEVEYKVKNNEDNSYLNITCENNIVNMKLINDDVETDRVHKNIMPVVKEVNSYVNQNKFCEEHLIKISEDNSIGISPYEIYIAVNNGEYIISHSFNSKNTNKSDDYIKVNNNGIKYDISENMDIKTLDSFLSNLSIDIELLPDYMKENIGKVKVKKRV